MGVWRVNAVLLSGFLIISNKDSNSSAIGKPLYA
ncbi:hypothetical protein EYZ11_013321 [Aspergillus tanneri]|uniref:Uncharacterized protein n=1 Tax=Aspergillus tanneri TaxID=1220188 RepID=A0A4V3UMG3_9EURO|nr:hypothetical protein EYZ11_013321 [Aspergillus tanneri]